MKTLSLGSALMAGFVAGTTAVSAHHSAAAAYDESRRVEAQGTVTRVLVRNPHSWVFLESTNDKGEKVVWQIEMGGVPAMAWTKEGLPIGAVVKVSGSPSRAPGTYGLTGARFTSPDGTALGPARGRGETPR